MPSYTEEACEQALIRLMHQYGDSIKRMCCIYLKDFGAAEDASQETFIKAYAHINQLLDGSVANEKAWLMRIAINTCKDALRSSWLRHVDRRQAIEELPLAAPMADEDHFALSQAVMKLSPKLKDLVLLHYYQGLNLRSCAQILNISPATATRRLQQAQKKLRIDLEKEGG